MRCQYSHLRTLHLMWMDKRTFEHIDETDGEIQSRKNCITGLCCGRMW